MNEELDSQLSAMFDDELPAAECELLARRLSRDEQLKARWGRYAVIGATVRAERGVRLNAALARKVNAAILAEPALEAGATPQRAPLSSWRWRQGVAGLAVAASVAAVSIFWLRGQAPLATGPVAARVGRCHTTSARHAPVAAQQRAAGPRPTATWCRARRRGAPWWSRSPSLPTMSWRTARFPHPSRAVISCRRS